MKTNISFKNINQLLIILFMVLSYTIAVGQERELDSEILVYILPDSLELGDGVTELNDIKKLKIKSKELDKAFKKIELKSIKKAFPDFNESDTLKTREDGKKIKLPNMARIFKLKLHNKDDINSVIEILSKEKCVLFAEPNYYDYQSHGFPNDEHYENGDQWGLNNYGQGGGTVDADIDAPEAWQITTGTNILVGVIDDGVDATHEDLSGKVSGDAGVYAGNADWAFGHGTHVAGIIAGIGNNTVGIAGVNWAANINSQRIENGTATDVYNAIIASVNAGSKVLNNSWGGYASSSTIRMAFANAYKLNVVSVASMGNDNTSSISYPAGYGQGIIAVGATDRNDFRSLWQNGSGSNYGNHIDVAAPGTSIWSSLPFANEYVSWNGTSMAAPFVTGIASLLKGYNTNLDNDDVENIIRLSADDQGTTGWDQYYGTGRVNAKKALDLLRAPYTLEQNSATGGSVYSSTGTYTTAFYGVSGLATNAYIVKRYEVRKTISLNSALLDKHVWGRGVNTVGFSAASPNFGMGWCDVVSSNATSATLRTYIYEVWSIGGSYLGYYPTTASNVEYEYSVLGYTLPAPTISMSGGQGDNPTLAYAYNESVVDHYVLKKEYDFGSGFSASYVNPASNPYTDHNVQITRFYGDLVARYSVKVIDALGNESSYSNTVATDGQSLWKENNEDEIEIGEIIEEYALNSNYPNPFNPTTQISYQIPKDGLVNLVVYNTLGQVVAELVNEHRSSGKYSVQFNASNLPSGIYFYKIESGSFSKSMKMLLLK